MLSKAIKFTDRIAGLVLVALLGGPDIRQEAPPRSILIIRPGGIGDAVLLLPMLHRLSAIYPDAKFEILAERRNAEVFSWSPVVSSVWCYDKPSELVKLFTRKFDLIIDTEQWYRLSAVVARLLRPSRLIGFATNERSRLLSDPCSYKQDEYEASMFMRLLVPLGVNTAGHLLEQLAFPALPHVKNISSNPYVVILPGASVAAKQWPAEQFAEVACFCEGMGFDVVVLGGSAEQDSSQVIARTLNRCHNLVGKTGLTESAAIISGASLMISGDTGLLHVAQLVEVPTVALFGPSNPQKWSKKGEKHVVVTACSACAPCSLFGSIPKCHHGFQCMQDITVEMVTTAVSCLMKKNRGNQ